MTSPFAHSFWSAAMFGALACALLVGGAACGDDAAPAADASAGDAGDAGRADAGEGGVAGRAGSEGALCTSCGGCSEELPVTSWSHQLEPIEYADPPPTSGNHDPCWASWGVHTDEVPARNWVHNLEHGGVVYLHNCSDGCAADLEVFTNLARQKQRTLLTPYSDLPTRFGLVAWGHRLLSDCVDPEVFQAFYEAHFDHGRESIGSGPPAACTQ